MKLDFITFDKNGQEVELLQNFVKDIQNLPKLVLVICVHYDDQQLKWHKVAYIMVRLGGVCNTIKLLLLIEIIFVDFVRSKKNTTNPFTKILTT
jgi:lipoprotein signal peptidase